MSTEPHAPPRTTFDRPTASTPLYKQRSWSPDTCRDEAWLRRKGNWKNRRSKSVTDEDVDELKACIELGFGFGFGSLPEENDHLDHHHHHQRQYHTLPALELYYVVNDNYNKSTLLSSSDCDTNTTSSTGSPHSPIYARGDNPQTVKSRLRQWAQVVACAVRQSS